MSTQVMNIMQLPNFCEQVHVPHSQVLSTNSHCRIRTVALETLMHQAVQLSSVAQFKVEVYELLCTEGHPRIVISATTRERAGCCHRTAPGQLQPTMK